MAKYVKIRLITKTLSIDSAFSMKKPVKYCMPAVSPRSNHTHTPNSSATVM